MAVAKKKDPVRAAAVRLLDEVLGEQRLLSERTTIVLSDLTPPERARAQRLVTETLRWLERADRILGKHLRKPPALHVRNILRLATVELCLGGAAHGVVTEAVDLTASHRRYGNLKGLVNAVLRKVAETGVENWSILRVPRLPKWLRVPLVEAWGADVIAACETAHSQGAPVDLTLRDSGGSSMEELDARVLPTGSLRLQSSAQISGLPGFEAGAWWVQDAAAAIPARVLRAEPAEPVLDLCAAPGGKTLQLAAAGANVTSVDDSSTRIARVEENLARTGLKACCMVADVFEVQGNWDAILLDAPCSATGTIRRHPDLPHAKDGTDFAALIEMQTAMIDHAWGLLNPGGRLVFCTCSLLPDEGEAQLAGALERHSDMTVTAGAFDLPGLDPAWVDDLGGLRLRPDYWADLGGMDGFYVAAMTKKR